MFLLANINVFCTLYNRGRFTPFLHHPFFLLHFLFVWELKILTVQLCKWNCCSFLLDTIGHGHHCLIPLFIMHCLPEITTDLQGKDVWWQWMSLAQYSPSCQWYLHTWKSPMLWALIHPIPWKTLAFSPFAENILDFFHLWHGELNVRYSRNKAYT